MSGMTAFFNKLLNFSSSFRIRIIKKYTYSIIRLIFECQHNIKSPGLYHPHAGIDLIRPKATRRNRGVPLCCLSLKKRGKPEDPTPDALLLESSGGAICLCGSGFQPRQTTATPCCRYIRGWKPLSLGKSHILVITNQSVEKQFTGIDLERN